VLLNATQVLILLALTIGVPTFYVSWKMRAPKGTKLKAVYDKETGLLIGMEAIVTMSKEEFAKRYPDSAAKVKDND
jgi:hypothetical protein